MHNSLSTFHPLVVRWFDGRFVKPTDIQEKAWPAIARGDHVLITAPTGSGKTLTAFLWALNQLIKNPHLTGSTSVLYVSPLKALNNDIQRNLLTPLEELRRVFEQSNRSFPIIRVLTRSGDTPQSERRQMLRHPPEILITTPESLNLMLSSAGGRSILGHIGTVILDEIHALVSEKRGTYLMTAVDRLVPIAGEFQRIALSATVRPLDVVAEFIGGYTLDGDPYNPLYKQRPVEMIQSDARKLYEIGIKLPADALPRHDGPPVAKKDIWHPIVGDLKNIIAENQSTLIFVNSRKLCEKITFLINLDEAFPLAYAHHGSLSRELRRTVERKLKQGELKAIVATNSLELGIDIGALDEVVLIQSPPSIASALQRIGRAGHQVDATSRGVLFPTHAHDFLEAAVLVAGIQAQDIEAARPVEGPLDVLAQIIVSMTGTQDWNVDHLYAFLRAGRPYRDLTREQFDLVLHMLAGRYADARIRELKARVSIDRVDNTVRAKKGALLALYMSGGVIPDRGYFNLRHQETNARIGELDEEFVWEARIGQIFTLGTQNWKIERITHNDVFVRQAGSNKTAPPFWIAESYNRGFHLSKKIGKFLVWINGNLKNGNLVDRLKSEHCMDSASADALVRFLSRQKEKTDCDLPHRHHLLVESVSAGPGNAPGDQIILHTFWGGRVNRPYAMALEAAWEEKFNEPLETFADNNCIYMVLAQDIQPDQLLAMVTQSRVVALIRRRLEGSGFFGARFRECAGRALLISNRKMNERMPLWVSRLKSKKLLDTVSGYDDFPILLETWRTCLLDMFDLESLETVLAELETGEIRWSAIAGSHPSPMAMSGSWRQINEYMYRDDSRSSAAQSRLREDLIEDLLASPGFRPDFSLNLIRQFERKRQRTIKGYAPQAARDLLDWTIERVMIPQPEWKTLLARMEKDNDISPDIMLDDLIGKIVTIQPQKGKTGVVVALENADLVAHTLFEGAHSVSVHPVIPGSSADHLPRPHDGNYLPPDTDNIASTRMRLVGEWLSFYGPLSVEKARNRLGMPAGLFDRVLNDLMEVGRVLRGAFTEGDQEDQICDKENFGILLRMKRVAAVPTFAPRDISALPFFIATIQGLTGRQSGKGQLYACLEQLSCYAAPAAVWESEILPARLENYDTSWLDTAMQASDLTWVGCGPERIYFGFEADLELARMENGPLNQSHNDQDGAGDDSPERGAEEKLELDGRGLFPDPGAKYDFGTLLRHSGRSASELSQVLWSAVWTGSITNDTFIALRKGIENKFKIPEVVPQGHSMITGRRRSRSTRHSNSSGKRFAKWKGALPYAGNWRKLDLETDEADLLEAAELDKDRVRLLFERYGLLFRELVFREQKPFQWRRIFRSLRLMELSGEIVSGYFFKDIPGPQFISHSAFQILRHLKPDQAVFWINAHDPASLCGIQVPALKASLPRRVSGTHLVYRGDRLVLVSHRNGRDLIFHVAEDDLDLPSYLGVLRHLMTRQFHRLRQITIETINDMPAADSAFVDVLRIAFEVMIDYKQVVLYKKGPIN